jgi:hypothetical protein
MPVEYAEKVSGLLKALQDSVSSQIFFNEMEVSRLDLGLSRRSLG